MDEQRRPSSGEHSWYQPVWHCAGGSGKNSKGQLCPKLDYLCTVCIVHCQGVMTEMRDCPVWPSSMSGRTLVVTL